MRGTRVAVVRFRYLFLALSSQFYSLKLSGVQLDSGPHRRGDGRVLNVLALGGRRFCSHDCVDQGLSVFDEKVALEADLAHGRVYDARLVDAEFDLTCLRLAHGAADIRSDGPGLRVRHQPARA